MEEPDMFCDNCKRNICVTNFATHSAFCARNIKICKLCDEPIRISSEKSHFEESHVTVPCGLCEIILEKWMMDKHKEICPKRPVICEFCEGDFSFDQFSEHVEFCGTRTEKCLMCKRYVMVRDKIKHSENHAQEVANQKKIKEMAISQNLANETAEALNKSNSYEQMKNEELKSQDVVPNADNKSEIVRTQDDHLENRREMGATAAVPDLLKRNKHYTTCQICGCTIQWIDYNVHTASCYGFAQNDDCVPSRGREESCLSKSNQNLQQDQKLEERNSQSHFRFHDELAEEDQVTRSCPYCKQMCTADRILHHIEVCPSNRFECQLCLEKVPECDRQEHQSSLCRMLVETYECPLCGINLPEKDKTSHESFYCSVLMDINSEDSAPYEVNKKKSSKVLGDFQCVKCKCSVSRKDISDHGCFQLGSLNDRNISPKEHKGAKPKHSASATTVPTAKVISKCKFCKTSLNVNILLYHETECVQQPVICNECQVSVPLGDCDSHRCKPSKTKTRREEKSKKESKKEQKSERSWFSRWSPFSNETSPKRCIEEKKEWNPPYVPPFEDRHIFDRNVYLPQPEFQETRIPCEFCTEQILISEIIEHQTGCNPDEVSYSKKDVRKEKKETSPKLKKQVYNSGATDNFFGTDNAKSVATARTPVYLRSNGTPGEYLDTRYTIVSSNTTAGNDDDSSLKKDVKPQNLKSVWNVDSPDVERDTEILIDVNSSDLSYKISLDRSNSSSDSDSDGNCSLMLSHINAKENEENVEHTSAEAVGNDNYSMKSRSYEKDLLNPHKDAQPEFAKKHSMDLSWNFEKYLVTDGMNGRDELKRYEDLMEFDDEIYSFESKIGLPLPRKDIPSGSVSEHSAEFTEKSEEHSNTYVNGQDKMKDLIEFDNEKYSVKSEIGCSFDSNSDPELKYKDAYGYILNVSRKTPSLDLVDSDLPKVDVERHEMETANPDLIKNLESTKPSVSVEQALNLLHLNDNELKQYATDLGLRKSRRKVSNNNDENVNYTDLLGSNNESKFDTQKKAFFIEPAPHYSHANGISPGNAFLYSSDPSKTGPAKNRKLLECTYEEDPVENCHKWRCRKPSDSNS